VTPAEIDKALRRALDELAPIVKDPLAREARIVAAAVSVLVVIAGEQEQRLRALELCPKAPGGRPGPHVWNGFTGEPGARCCHCDTPRGAGV